MSELKEVKIIESPQRVRFIILTDHVFSDKEKQKFPSKVINITKRTKLLKLKDLEEYDYIVCNMRDIEVREFYNHIIKDDDFNKYHVISFTEDPEEFKNCGTETNIRTIPEVKDCLTWEFNDCLLSVDVVVKSPALKSFLSLLTPCCHS